jgi:hypothetical protein
MVSSDSEILLRHLDMRDRTAAVLHLHLKVLLLRVFQVAIY